MNEKRKTILLRILIIAALLAAAGICLYLYLHFGKSLIELVKDTERFKTWIDGFGVWGIIVFVVIRIVQTVFKFIPTEPIEIGAGLVWGWFGGLMLCLLGNILGSVVILLMTRRIGTRILKIFHLENKLQSMRFLQDREKRNRLLFIFYLVPGTPKDTMTYFVGLTDMNMIEFLILSSIARIPAIVSSTICGAYLGANNFKVAAIVFIVTALLSIPGAFLYKKISARYVQNRPETDPGPEPEKDGDSADLLGNYDFKTIYDRKGNEFIVFAGSRAEKDIADVEITDKTAFEAVQNHIHVFEKIGFVKFFSLRKEGRNLCESVLQSLKQKYPTRDFVVYVTLTLHDAMILRFHQRWNDESDYYSDKVPYKNTFLIKTASDDNPMK